MAKLSESSFSVDVDVNLSVDAHRQLLTLAREALQDPNVANASLSSQIGELRIEVRLER